MGADAVLVVRYRLLDGPVTLEAEGLAQPRVTLGGTGGYQQAVLPLAGGAAKTGLTLRHAGGGAVEIDGYALVAADQAAAVRFAPEDANTEPEILPGPVPDSRLLKYAQLDHYYGVRWYRERTFVRQYRNGILDGFFPRNSMRKTAPILEGDRRGHYLAVQFNGTSLAPRGGETIWAVVASGSREQVTRALQLPAAEARAAWRHARATAAPPPSLPQGGRYALARQLIRANLLLNVVYPVYTQDQYIRHFTPGKWWDTLYTWDSGFLGIGMAAVAPHLSADILNAYTTAPGAAAAFIHHGTPLPVQHSQFLELWNRSQDRRLLEHAYPRLRQYYEFLVGRLPGSTTATLKSGLLSTWDYFYNSGGWDDYPAQVHMHASGLAPRTAPMVTTAHVIRAARILRMAALETGRADDARRYEDDIARLGAAVQAHAWDAASGYFGYVLHDAAGQPSGLLRTASGEQYNKGMDGVAPFVAGITTPAQDAVILRHLRENGALWSPIGLTTVDQRAGYYSPKGYWNGTVWFPHQWFIWKSLLDHGQPAQAWRVASTALGLYQREAPASWISAEHFEIATGQGVGWHQFSGLSAPIAAWYDAYFRLGSLTTGYDVWVRTQRHDQARHRLEAELALYSPRREGHLSVLATLAPGRYRATWNGAVVPVTVTAGMPGALAVSLPLDGAREGKLVLQRQP